MWLRGWRISIWIYLIQQKRWWSPPPLPITLALLPLPMPILDLRSTIVIFPTGSFISKSWLTTMRPHLILKVAPQFSTGFAIAKGDVRMSRRIMVYWLFFPFPLFHFFTNQLGENTSLRDTKKKKIVWRWLRDPIWFGNYEYGFLVVYLISSSKVWTFLPYDIFISFKKNKCILTSFCFTLCYG